MNLSPAARCLALLASLGRVAIQRLPHGGYTTAITPDARGRHWNLLLLRLDWHPVWRLGGGLVLNLRTRATPDDVRKVAHLARLQLPDYSTPQPLALAAIVRLLVRALHEPRNLGLLGRCPNLNLHSVLALNPTLRLP